jgi:hypothetical protein
VAVVAGHAGKLFGFEVSHGVVGGVTHSAPGETGEGGSGTAGRTNALERSKEVFELFERIRRSETFGADGRGTAGRAMGVLLNGDIISISADDGSGPGGNEGIAGNVFAADDGLQKKSVVGAFGEAFVSGDGSKMVGKERAIDGDSDAGGGVRSGGMAVGDDTC